MSLIVNIGSALSISKGYSINVNKSSPLGPTPLPTPTPTPTPTATPTPTPTPTATPTPTPTPTATPTPTPTPAPLSANNIAFVGSNNYSGNGTNTTNYDYFTNIQTVCSINGGAYNTPHEFKDITCTYNANFALSSDGTVYCAGLNTLGVFGVSGRSSQNFLWYTPLTAVIDNGSYITYPKFNKIITQDTNAAVVLLSGKDAYSAGSNSTAKAGRSGDLETYIRINGKWDKAAPVNGSIYMISGSDLYFSGNNNNGQTGFGASPASYATLTKVYSANTTDINIVGTSYIGAYAMLSAGYLYGTGYNASGQIGTGNAATRTVWTRVSAVSADDGQSLIYDPTFTKFPSVLNTGALSYSMILSGKKLYSCGDNNYGFLGIGPKEGTLNTPKTPEGIFTPVMSAKLVSNITSGDQIVINPRFDDVFAYMGGAFAISGTAIFFAGDTVLGTTGASPYHFTTGDTTIFTLLTNTPFISGIACNQFNITILKTYTS